MSSKNNEITEKQNDISLSFIIDDIEYHCSEKHITGQQLRKLCNLAQQKELFLIKSETGETELVKDEDIIDLTQPGFKRFSTKKRYKLVIDGKHFEWESQFITGSQLKLLSNIVDGYAIFYCLKNLPETKHVSDTDTVDLSTPGIDHFYSEVIPIKIEINSKEYAIKAGIYTVTQIKELGNINPAYEVEQLIDGKLVPLDDNGTVQIKGGEQFFSHVRDGSSADHTPLPESEINELKKIAPSLSLAEEGGYRYLLIDNLKLPEGCSPSTTQALLCPDPKDGYQSRLYFESVISGRPGLNWNGSIIILDKTWYSYSWQTNPGLRLAEKLMVHLGALRSR